MLAPVTDYILFKKEFDSRFKQTVLDNPKLEILCHQLFKIGTAYVVGGFLRDIALGQESRDMISLLICLLTIFRIFLNV